MNMNMLLAIVDSRVSEERVATGRYKVECSCLAPSYFNEVFFAVQKYWQLKRGHHINCVITDTTTNCIVNPNTALDF